jgi:acetolactate synthase small subunit
MADPDCHGMKEFRIYLNDEPGALASFTRGIANSGLNLRSLYVMSVDGNQATIGYTTD